MLEKCRGTRQAHDRAVYARIFTAIDNARRPIAELVLACAYDSIAGLQTNENGCLVAYADDIRVLRQFAKILIQRRNLFRDLRTPRKPKGDKGPDSGQLPLL
jgi:hypothetical protein